MLIVLLLYVVWTVNVSPTLTLYVELYANPFNKPMNRTRKRNNSLKYFIKIKLKKERELPDAYPSSWYRQAPQQWTSTEKFTPLWGMNPPHPCSHCLKLAVSEEENKSSLLKLWYVSNGCRPPPWLVIKLYFSLWWSGCAHGARSSLIFLFSVCFLSNIF